jgi:hypothetical protein
MGRYYDLDFFDDGDLDGDKCRICLGGSEPLISPCKCIGTMKYVHNDCLVQWKRSKLQQNVQDDFIQKLNNSPTFSCEVCKCSLPYESRLYCSETTVNVIAQTSSLVTIFAFLICMGFILCTLYSFAVPMVEPIAEKTIFKMSEIYRGVANPKSQRLNWIKKSKIVFTLNKMLEWLAKQSKPYWKKMIIFRRPIFIKVRAALVRAQRKKFDGAYMINFWKTHSIPRFHSTFEKINIPLKVNQFTGSNRAIKYQFSGEKESDSSVFDIAFDNMLIGKTFKNSVDLMLLAATKCFVFKNTLPAFFHHFIA